MFNEKIDALDGAGAGIGRSSALTESAIASGVYAVECRDASGNIKWSDSIKNVVTTAGKNDALDKYLAGSAYTAAWYLGLISATGYASVPVVGDTSASHATWTEDQGYSQGTRPAAAWCRQGAFA